MPGERAIVVGVAGHVDHGKTELVRALTGVDTDRLPEEKRRGISIDLGFAHLPLPGGRVVAFVDVPGHERFVRNMVAGVHGVDAAILVVASDEGVMPQTREHLDILRLLGADRGLVVLTKADLADAELLALVREDASRLVSGTGLAEAPVLAVSSRTGEGLAELRDALAELVDRLAPGRGGERDRSPGGAAPSPTGARSSGGAVRLPIDRAFTVPGFGTVVTGTLVSGTLRVGDRLEILPEGMPVRVRGLQSHGATLEAVAPGRRVAVNLAGAEREEASRGRTLATPGAFRAERLLAARVEFLDGLAPEAADGRRLRLHSGTDDVPVRVVVLGPAEDPVSTAEPQAGRPVFARLHTARLVVAAPGDRFLLRSLSPARTVGGGVVVDAGRRYRKGSREDLDHLRALLQGGAGDLVRRPLLAGPAAVADLAGATGLSREEALAAVEALVAEGWARWLDGERRDAAIAEERLAALREGLARGAREYLERYPLRRGWPLAEARRELLPGIDARLAQLACEAAARTGAAEIAGDVVRPAGGDVPEWPEEARRAVALTRAAYEEAGLMPPEVGAVEERLRAEGIGVPAAEAVRHLAERGELVAVAEGMYFSRGAVDRARERVVAALSGGREATMSELREVLGTSRKYAIPLAEYLDRAGVTKRTGDVRRLARPF